MSETRDLLAKISALRQRLEQAQGLVNEARSAAAAILTEGGPLDKAVKAAGDHDVAMGAALLAVAGVPEGREPRQISSRARRVLERGKELLEHLRGLAGAFAEGVEPSPLQPLYRDTVSMIDTALRTVSLLPESVSAQMQLCRGLEVTLEEVASRLRTLASGTRHRVREEQQIDTLAAVLFTLDAGQPIDPAGLYSLADEVLAEARSCEPLRFLEAPPDDLPRSVACHSLTVARVLARVVRHDPELRGKARDAVLAGLLHDVGMLGVPTGVLGEPGPLDPESRRLIEAHPVVGAQQVAGLLPDAPWVAEAVGAHQERLDGTGYPDGLKGNTVRPLARLLAVCDTYAAMCCGRPHRPARATRTALADTLLLAEQGQLDKAHAERLLTLSFYPVGSVVELAHGEVGVVVATPSARADLNAPSRPVVALLTDSKGQPLARPRHLDLAEAEDHSIVRPLTAPERTELLSKRFPQWA
jgi:HD-GYP domain-containing protein (c-di-GMP phosphodiesterase class II)